MIETINVQSLWIGGNYIYRSDDIPELWIKHRNIETATYLMYQALDTILPQKYDLKDTENIEKIKLNIGLLEKHTLH